MKLIHWFYWSFNIKSENVPTFLDEALRIVHYNSLCWSGAILNFAKHPVVPRRLNRSDDNLCKFTMWREKGKPLTMGLLPTYSPGTGCGDSHSWCSPLLPGTKIEWVWSVCPCIPPLMPEKWGGFSGGFKWLLHNDGRNPCPHFALALKKIKKVDISLVTLKISPNGWYFVVSFEEKSEPLFVVVVGEEGGVDCKGRDPYLPWPLVSLDNTFPNLLNGLFTACSSLYVYC